jgi:CHAT domain-containing protein
MKKSLLLLLCFLTFGWRFAASQSPEITDKFQQRYSNIYITHATDTLKASQEALALYREVEDNEELQTSTNYFILTSLFKTLIGDEELAGECEKKAYALMQPAAAVAKPESYDSPQTEWAYEFASELYKSIDLSFGKEALKFLNENASLQNYNNFSALAGFFERVGDYKRAEELYEIGIEKINVEKNEMAVLSPYALFLLKLGKYQKAKDLLILNAELSMGADSLYAVAYESDRVMIESNYYRSIGDYFSFINAVQEFYEGLEASYQGPDEFNVYPRLGRNLQALGYMQLREWDKAEENYIIADSLEKEFLRNYNEKFPNMEFPSMSFLNTFLAMRGKLSNFEIPTQELDAYHQYFSNAQIPISLQQKALQAQQYAFFHDERYRTLYLQLMKETTIKNFEESTRPNANYAYFLMRDRDIKESQKYYFDLFDQNLEWINDIIFTFGEKDFVTWYNNQLREGYNNFHTFVRLAKENDWDNYGRLTSKAFNNILLTKSIAFKGIRKRKKGFENLNSPEIVELYNHWIQKKQDLIRLYQLVQPNENNLANELPGAATPTPQIPISQDSVLQLQREVSDLETRLSTEAKNFKSTLRITEPDWKELRSRLQPGEAAIEIVRFHWRDQIYLTDTSYYAAYIIRHDSPHLEVVYLPTLASQLDTRFYSQYRNSIKLKIEDNTSYDQYWKPIIETLEGIKTIYFSPDGIYHLISIPSLRNPETGQYVIDEINLRNVSSTENVKMASLDNQLSGKAILVARPAFNIRNNSGTQAFEHSSRSFSKNFRNADISDLPGTEAEIQSIARQLESQEITVEKLIGSEATEDAFYDFESPFLLHIATHGFWSGTESATPGFRMFNAMVNSGLLLSGVVDYYSADQRNESNDGILTAYEAQDLNLEGTRLVVLSACETGLGDFDAGEGVYGLQRAFRTAGSASIMTSLWKVDDQGTKDYMISFYKYLSELNNPGEANQAAQLEMKEKYREPYYWGAFVLMTN